MNAAAAVGILLGAYFLGSVPVAWLLGRSHHADLRQLGSGNPGTSNLFRNLGVRLAILAGPLQFAQGVVPVVVARAVGGDGTLPDLAALFAVAGSGWPIWFGFNGQRAIAVATGAAAALNPALLAVLLICFAVGALSHAIALGVLGGFVILPIAGALAGGTELALTCLGMLAAVVLRRLEGLHEDLRSVRSPAERRVVWRRVFLDERPGQVLVGPREAAGSTHHGA